MAEILNRKQLGRLCGSRGDAIEWCKQIGLLPTSKRCEVHQTEMSLTASTGGRGVWPTPLRKAQGTVEGGQAWSPSPNPRNLRCSCRMRRVPVLCEQVRGQAGRIPLASTDAKGEQKPVYGSSESNCRQLLNPNKDFN